MFWLQRNHWESGVVRYEQVSKMEGVRGGVMVPPKNGRNVAQLVVNVGDLLLTVKTSEI